MGYCPNISSWISPLMTRLLILTTTSFNNFHLWHFFFLFWNHLFSIIKIWFFQSFIKLVNLSCKLYSVTFISKFLFYSFFYSNANFSETSSPLILFYLSVFTLYFRAVCKYGYGLRRAEFYLCFFCILRIVPHMWMNLFVFT